MLNGAAEIQGSVWHDGDGDGVWHDGEEGLPGWTIYLDANQNSVWDLGEAHAIADADGNYAFKELLPDTYWVCELPRTGWVQSAPGEPDFCYEVTVALGERATGKDFGSYRFGSISGHVFADTNANGIEDTNERRLIGWSVYLDTNDNAELDPGEPSTVTDSAGAYAFTGLAPGSYRVAEILHDGWTRTSPAGSGIHTVMLGSAQHLGEIDFGVQPPNETLGPRVTSTAPSPGISLAHSPQEFTVTFDERVDPLSVNDSAIVVQGSGGDGIFGDGNEQSVAGHVTVAPDGEGVTYELSPGALREVASLMSGTLSDVVAVGDVLYGADGRGLKIFDVSDLTTPILLGSYDTLGNASALSVAGSFVYLADGEAGLRVIGIDDLTEPVEVGSYDTPGYAMDVVVLHSYVYVADKTEGLRVIDVSDPALPDEVGSWDTPGNAYGVTVVGPYAYVADDTEGLRVIDVTVPAAPNEVGACDTPGNARGVSVMGSYAYVADGSQGIRTIDVADPAAPNEVGFHNTPGSATRVAVQGTHAFVADGDGGLRVLDVSTPAVLSEIAFFDTSGSVSSVAAAGLFAYVADGDRGLRVIDIGDLTGLVEVGSYDPPASVRNVSVAGSYAYVVADGSLRVIDVSDPTGPVEVASCSPEGLGSGGVCVESGYAYAMTQYGFSVIDVRSPELPVEVGRYVAEYGGMSFVQHVLVSGSYAYVTIFREGLRVIDVSSPAMPVEVGAYSTSEIIVDVAVSGSYAYLAVDSGRGWDGDVLLLLDVSDPTHPIQVGSWPTQDAGSYYSASAVHVVGSYAYLASGHGSREDLSVIDVSDPTSPVTMGSCYSGEQVSDIEVVGTYAYATDFSSGLHVIDVRNPALPIEVGSYATQGDARSVAVAGPHAYVADGEAGLCVIDVSDPVGLREMGNYSLPADPRDVAIAGSYAYVADGTSGLHVIDVTDQEKPVPVGVCEFEGEARDVEVVGDYAYLASGGQGLAIVDISNPATPAMAAMYPWSQYGYPPEPEAVSVAGSHAYVVDGLGGVIKVIDVSAPNRPAEVADYDIYANDIAVASSYAYLVGGTLLSVLDVSDPAAPVETGSLATSGYATAVSVSGSHAYVACDEVMLVIDVSDPSAPTQVGSWDLPDFWSPSDISVVGHYAYLSSSGSVRVVDVSDPTAPKQVASHDIPGGALGVAVKGSYAYAAVPGGLRVLEITPVQLPEDSYRVTLNGTGDGTPPITDLMGNALDGDGEFQFPYPIDDLPSGDGVAGGDFVYEFRVERPDTGPYVTCLPVAGLSVPVDHLLVTFNETLDSATFTEADLTLTGPGGQIAIDQVSLIEASTYRLAFAPQRFRGSYGLAIGPDIMDLDGFLMDQDRDGNRGEPVEDQYTATFDILAGPYITDHVPSGEQTAPVSAITVTFDQAIAPDTFTAADVQIEGASGPIVVADDPRHTDGTSYQVQFPEQSQYGTYHVYIGPNIENALDAEMDQDGDGFVGEDTDDRYDALFSIIDVVGPRGIGHTPDGPVNTLIDHVDVTFDEAIDADSLDVSDVSVTGPAGPIQAQGVSPLSAVSFRVAFPQQTAEGTYNVTIGPSIADTAGNLMDQDQDGRKDEPTDDQYTAALVIDLTRPQVASHTPQGIQNAPVECLQVQFDEAIDPTTFPIGVVHVTGPNGSVAATQVTQLAPDLFEVIIPATPIEGPFNVAIDPLIGDLAGNLLAAPGYSFSFDQLFPDLTVTHVAWPQEGRAGQDVDILFTVTNGGQGIATGAWNDTAVFSTDTTFGNDEQLIELRYDSAPNGLPPGESYTRAATVTLPVNATGSAWVFITTDSDTESVESNEQNNTTMGSQALLVSTRPYADLQVTQVNGPSTLGAGDYATLSWDVYNGGTGSTSAPAWYDRVYLSSDTVIDPADIQLGSARNPDFLAPGESYHQTHELSIPDGTPRASYYLLVKADVGDVEEEFDLEDNNVGSSVSTADVVTPTGPVLTVTSIVAPGTVEPGERPLITWTIENTGDQTITTGWSGGTGWDDGLALSVDDVYDENVDYFLGSHTYWHGLPLRPGESYTSTGTPLQAIPAWAPGTYYVIVLPDTHFGAGSGFGQSTMPRNYGTEATELVISEPADLIVTDLTAPTQATSGLPMDVSWSVLNNGLGRTHVTSWKDAVYLSTDATLDGSDVLVDFAEHDGELFSGGSYSQTNVQMEVPRGIGGNYYLIVHTDYETKVYESDDANNTRTSDAVTPVTLIQSDLVPTIDTSPAAGLAGQTIDVTRTVQNAGPDTTALGTWTDTFYLSADANLNVAEDTKVGDFTYSGGALPSTGSYTLTESLNVPQGTEGTFSLFLVTDSADALYEHNGENNNIAVAASQIQIQDLAPDLNIVTFTAPTAATAGSTLDLTGSIRNDGTSAAEGPWTDVVYLSTDATLDKDQDTQLDAFVRTEDVAMGEDYEPHHSPFEVQLPDGLSGDYYLFLVVDDGGSLYEKGATDNNVLVTGPIAVTDLKADLAVESASAPATGTANQLIDVSFLIGNPGQEAATGKWYDAFYLSTDTTFNADTDILFGVFEHSQAVAVSDIYGPLTSPARVRLPDRIDGQYHIFVRPDYTNAIPELNDADAYLIPTPIDITYLPADLQVTTLTAPTSATAGAPINVSFTVTNAGLAATTELNWQDGVYLSTDLTFDPAGDIEFGLISHQGRLAASGSYAVSRSFTLPQHLDGTYHLYTFTDARRQVYEHNLEGNNKTAADPMVVARVEADLQVTNLNVPAAGATGDTIQVDYTVTNAGDDATAALSWSDRVYLSTDNVLDANDSVLATFRHDGALASGASYNMSRNVTLSTDVVGSLFVIVKTDAAATNEVYEYQAEDNNTASSGIDVTYAPSPDLQVASIVAHATAWSGQNLHLEWTATNAGDATASALQDGWYDSAYLSRDIYLDRDTDVYLGSVPYSGTLASSAQYASPLALDARLDPGLSGPYYVLVATDSNDRVLERGAETNNTGVSPSLLQVNLTPPSDLQVTDITVPAPAIYGAEVDWTYEVTNQDTLDAFGSWYDTVYLSADNRWDLNDYRIGRVQHVGDVAHAASYSETLTANVPGVIPGDYYVVVRTDIRDDLRELDETNNTSASATTFTVQGRELTPGVPAAGTLDVEQSAYYEVNVGRGEDLRVTLSGAAASGAELYIANGYMPTRGVYEAMGTATGGSDPQVRIAGTETGYYYLLLYGRYAGTGTGYDLSANVLSTGLTSMTPDSGGNTGEVTAFIQGESLPTDADAVLVSPTGATLPASRVWAGDGSGFYAMFNLDGQTPGLHDLEVTGANAYILAADIFAVGSGGSADFQAELLVPTIVRARAPFTMEVEYANLGTIDIPSPLLTITGPDGVGFGLESGNFLSYGSIQFMAYSSTGPTGVLQPGDTERVQFFCSGVDQATNEYTLTSLEVDPSNPTPELIDWDGMEEDYQPPYLTDAEWDPIWSVFTRELGATWPEVASKLAQQLTEEPRHSMPNIVVEDLMRDAFRAVSGGGGGGMTDATPPYVVTHTPVYILPGVVGGLDIFFSEMIDPATFTFDDIIIADPLGGAVPLTGLDPVNDRLWHLAFDPLLGPGVFDVAIGPGILDLVGLPIDQDRDGQPGEPLEDVYAADFMVRLNGARPTTFITSTSPQTPQCNIDHIVVYFSQPIHFQTFTPADVVVTGPDGQVSVLDIIQLTSTSYQVVLPDLSVIGTYDFTILSDITDLNGNRVDFDMDGVPDHPSGRGLRSSLIVADLVGPHVKYHSPALDVPPPVDHFLVTFNEAIDPTTFTAVDVTLAGPNGDVAVTGVTIIDGQIFGIEFAQQAAEGRYTFTIGPNISDLHGNAMNRNGNSPDGNAGGPYTGTFDVFAPDIIVTGSATYSNYLKEFFTKAHVAVQLWEQNGAKDLTPGLPSAGDEVDKLISDWNSMSDAARGTWGSDFTTDAGTFRFHQDTAGNPIHNIDTAVTTASEVGTTADFYVVVMAKNRYAMVTDHRKPQYRQPHPDNVFYEDFYPKGKPSWLKGWWPHGHPYGFEVAGPLPDIWEEVFHETSGVTQPGPNALVTINAVISMDEFGPCEWIYYGANWVRDNIDEAPRKFIAVSAYDGPSDNAASTFDGYLIMGADRIKSPQTHLHEYGHAIQHSFTQDFRPFPYKSGSYGIIQLGSQPTTTMAEAWAVFFAAKVLEDKNLPKALLPEQLHLNRQAKWFETNDFWMAWDAYAGIADNDAAHDSLINAADLAGKFDGVNDDHNTGRYVLGATTSIFWDLADGAGDDDDEVCDLKGLWKAVKETTATNTIDAFYTKYKANEGGNTAADNAINAIFIDHGIGVADDRFDEDENDTNDTPGGPRTITTEDMKKPFVMAEEGPGAGDWYQWVVLPRNGDPEYEATVSIEFEERYGDLDLFVYVYEGEGATPVFEGYRLGQDRETITVTGLDSTRQYRFLVGVCGHGARRPKPGGGWDEFAGGDMNPHYTISVVGALPGAQTDTEKDKRNQSTAGTHDPNDKLAPGGFGDANYLRESTVMPYTVRFENDPEATASCVLVTISDQMDADLDWTTFELGDIEFSNHLIDVPEGLTYFETIYDLRPEGNDLLVEIVGDFNVNTGMAQWAFTGLDPATGELTYDPFAGFLPPNDPDVHDGEGFGKYTVQPKAGLPSGTEITNMATIVFDWNEPMDTPLVLNTIDSGAPTSSVTARPATTNTESFLVQWTGADDANGSGIANFDVFVSDNGADFVPWLENTTATQGGFQGAEGHTYSFYSIATDNVGHREPGKAAEATTHVTQRPIIGSLSGSPDPVGQSQTLVLTANSASDADGTIARVEFYRDLNGNGTLEVEDDALLGDGVSAGNDWAWSGVVDWDAGTHTYFARAKDNDGAWSHVLATTGAVFLPATIRGAKWHDLDGDGVRDEGEPVLAGWTIYIDENQDGQLTDGEASDVTDANGDYSLTGLAAGTYVVAEVAQRDWVQTFPASPGRHTVVLTGGQVEESIDFGNQYLADWTIMTYLAADNDLEEAALDDFLEMASVGSTDDVRVVVQLDRAPGEDATYGDWMDTRRGVIELNDVPDTNWGTSLGEVNMADPASLTDFALWGIQSYPAERYALVVWDHGDGWPGVAVDDTDGGDMIGTVELGNVLDLIVQELGRPLDLLGLDACLMGMQEVAYEVRDAALVMVASEELVPDDGWPYDEVLTDLNANALMTAAELGTAIVQRFVTSYSGGSQGDEEATLSALDLAEADRVATAVDGLALALLAEYDQYHAQIQTARDAAQRYDEEPSHIMDLYDFAELVDANVPDQTIKIAAQAVMDAIANHEVIEEGHYGGIVAGSHGVSIYDPVSMTYDTGYGLLAFAGATHWDEFISVESVELPMPVSGTGRAVLDGSDLVILDESGNEVLRRPFAEVSEIEITGTGGDDTFVLDFSNGNPIPPGGLTFNGGGGNDAVQIVGGSFPTTTYSYTNASNGSIELFDGTRTSTITYTGLEPITSSAAASDVILNLPASADEAVLEHVGAAGSGLLRLRSVNGTFETTTFAVPSNSITINAGAGNDTLSVIPVPVECTINGGAHNAGTAGDRLIVDAQGWDAVDTGAAVVVSGFPRINYAGMESVDIRNEQASETGTWAAVSNWSYGKEGWEFGTLDFGSGGTMSGQLSTSTGGAATVDGCYEMADREAFTWTTSVHEDGSAPCTYSIRDGQMSPACNTIVAPQLDLDGSGAAGDVVMVKKGEDYRPEDLVGEWTFVGKFTGGARECWEYGTLSFDEAGDLDGQLVDNQGNTASITGTYTIDATGAFAATLNWTGGGAANHVLDGQMGADRNVIIGAQRKDASDPSWGNIVLTRNGTSCSAADMAGDWLFVSNWSDADRVGYDYGRVVLDASGNILGGYFVDTPGHVHEITGTYTFDGQGNVTFSMLTGPVETGGPDGPSQFYVLPYRNEVTHARMAADGEMIIGVQGDGDGGHGSIFWVREGDFEYVIGRDEPILEYKDADGDRVVVHLRSQSGRATLTRPTAFIDGPADARAIVLEGTDEQSSLTIRVYETGTVPNDGTTIGSITGSGIGELDMPQVDLVGNTVDLSGPLSTLTVRDMKDGSDMRLGGNATDELMLTARNVGDVDLLFPGVLTRIVVDGWADGEVRVHHVGSLEARAGDFGADLILHGSDSDGRSLGSATVAGSLAGERWEISGDVYRVHVDGSVTADIEIDGDLGRAFRVRRRGRRRWVTEGFWSGGDLDGSVTVNGRAYTLAVGGNVAGVLTVNGDADSLVVGGVGSSTARNGGAEGGVTVHGNVGALEVLGEILAPVDVGGNLGRLDAHEGTSAAGTIHVAGDLGRQFTVRRRGGRRRVTEGLWSGGDLGGALSVDGKAYRIDVHGEIQAVVMIGGEADNIVAGDGLSGTVVVGQSKAIGGEGGSLASFSSGGSLSGRLMVYGDAGHIEVRDGQIQAEVEVCGSLDRLDAEDGTSASGAIRVSGDLGRQYRVRRGGRRRWVTEGLWSGGDLAGTLTVNGKVHRVDVQGQIQNAVVIGGGASSIVAGRGTSATGRIEVAGDVDTLVVSGQILASIRIGGNAGRIDASDGTAAGAAIEVGGDLGRQYPRRVRGRRRWVTEGLSSGGDVMGDVTVGGTAWKTEIAGDLVDATISAQTLTSVTVAGAIRADGPELIQSLLAESMFYIRDSGWAGYVGGGTVHVFGGTVIAQVG